MPEVSYIPDPKGSAPDFLSRQYGCRECGGGAGTPTVETFTTPGAAVWQAPAGVTSVTVEVWGGGASGDTHVLVPGGGGGGGAYARSDLVVVPGNNYNYFVGSGGASGASGANGTGSWFNTSGTLFADFGREDNFDTLGSDGDGGIQGKASNSIGTTKFSGGFGGTAGVGAGGGGSSAGSAANGNNGASGSILNGPNLGGAAVLDGGSGGDGGGLNGTNGSSPGGGGGGGKTTGVGGAGGNGKVKISYLLP